MNQPIDQRDDTGAEIYSGFAQTAIKKPARTTGRGFLLYFCRKISSIEQERKCRELRESKKNDERRKGHGDKNRNHIVVFRNH
ncbi:MAG: hypothetical protein DIZ77_10555 [endosymbiont of Seepiophila jonesi]|uniref:Uncharacterized protein n=1 Tax=endosymbiont of Lamellibrachia luymesi TaxID=2200907 RepID=A0A370DYV9_9GAMM|nr:MAG: hypothetical protein DIZ77_10555 [endosymbiont of Seepiophila jonesi]RDH91777.1 MAG: hypothetical protein DIZ79_05210 [endosymbiont of Lamellibrachia luymesi]